MLNNTDKAGRASRFRTRLTEAIKTAGISQSALARAIGVDRSTLSQALTDSGARMPSAHVVGACAQARVLKPSLDMAAFRPIDSLSAIGWT